MLYPGQPHQQFNGAPHGGKALNPITRRTLLGAAGLGAAGAVIGLTGTPASAALPEYNEIWSAPLHMNGASSPAKQAFNQTFYNRLETWMSFYYSNSPGHWITPQKINHLGVYDPDPPTSMHAQGRAIDLQNLYFTDSNTGSLFKAFDCVWKSGTGGWGNTQSGSTLTTTRKRYWAAVAGLSYHFRDVLHYAYNAEHYNHVHVDNSISGSANSTFSTGSTAQVKMVQACLNHIWGYTAVTIDGGYGPQTTDYSNRALVRMGRSGYLTTSQTNWLEFCKASLRFGTGAQSY
jgi:hypothetical protein